MRPLAEGLDHPEGVAYDPDAHVVWAGGEAGQLYRVDPDSGAWTEQARVRAADCGASAGPRPIQLAYGRADRGRRPSRNTRARG